MKETNLIEFKRELTNELEKEIVAFLNSRQGGVLSIGIDKEGHVVGVNDLDGDMLKIKDRLKNNILPSCLGLFDVLYENKSGKDIINITVASGTEQPYYIKKHGMSEKGCFIRIGTASEPMSVKLIEETFTKRTRHSLRKIRSNKQDLSFSQLKIYYQEVGKDLNDKFASNLDLLTEEGEYNYVAFLLSDKNSASFKVAKFAGENKVDLIENEEYGYCSIVKSTQQVLDKLDVENKTFATVTGNAQRTEKRMIDKTALREALINAVVHNDYTGEDMPVVEIYSNRLSIVSYGGLVEGLSLEEFFSGRSRPRNRELMRVFKDFDLVEQLGSGIHRILKSYNQSIFNVSENFIEISFPFENESGGTIGGTIILTNRDISILNACRVAKSRREILEDLLHVSNRTKNYETNMRHLIDAGLLNLTNPNVLTNPAQKYYTSELGLKYLKDSV